MNSIVDQILPADFRPWAGQYRTADSPEALEAINAQTLAGGAPGRLTGLGLVVVPAAYDGETIPGIREKDLPALVRKLRGMEGITVRGCLVRPALAGADGKTVAACFHEVYQVAKRMTALLPCAMPWLGFGGMLAPIRACIGADPAAAEPIRTAARIVAMQNRTAFYAKLFID